MTSNSEPPKAIVGRLSVGINGKAWRELKQQGVSDDDIEKAITRCVENAKLDPAKYKAPLDWILQFESRKYY
jgi:hypothetical protein